DVYKETAIKMDPNASKTYFQKGMLLAGLGDTNAAMENLDKVIELSPDDPKAYYYKAIALKEIHKYKEAVELFKKAIDINADYAIANFHLAEILYDQQDHDQAIQYYKNAYDTWELRVKNNPGYFVQSTKTAQNYRKAKRLLYTKGVIKTKDYRISMKSPTAKKDEDKGSSKSGFKMNFLRNMKKKQKTMDEF
ncbi:hypothetical protein BVY03_00970, partial [bacterium K02(2017)]